MFGSCPFIQSLANEINIASKETRDYGANLVISSQAGNKNRSNIWSNKRRDKSNRDVSAKKEIYLLL